MADDAFSWPEHINTILGLRGASLDLRSGAWLNVPNARSFQALNIEAWRQSQPVS